MSSTNAKPHKRQSTKPKLKVEMLALIGVTLFSTGLLFVSVPSLFPDASSAIWIKAGLLALAGGLVSFATNHFAIARAAPLAVLGYPVAGIIGASGIIAIGSGLFAVTYAGLTLPGTARLELQGAFNDRTHYVAALSAETSAFGDTASALRAAASDLAQSASCERATSCISGRGAGGVGPVYRVTSTVAGRAGSVLGQIEEAEKERIVILARLNGELETFRDALNSGEGRIWNRFQSLQTIDARLLQAGEELVRAMPVSLLRSYGDELKAGIAINGRAEASTTLSRIMAGHGAAIHDALEEVTRARETRPVATPFPVRPGVADTFGYLAHFWPIAIIALIAELILPISLWLYTLINLAWLVDRDLPKQARPQAKSDPFGQLMDMRESGDENGATGHAQSQQKSRGNGAHLNGKAPGDPAGMPQPRIGSHDDPKRR